MPTDAPLDECRRRAARAAEARDAAEALAWTRRALAHAPDDARLHSDEGFFLEWLGEGEGALAAYSRAAQLGDAGADLLAARLHLRRGADADVVIDHLVRALSRAPHLAPEVREDAPLYGPLLDDPRLKGALSAAESGGGASDPGAPSP